MSWFRSAAIAAALMIAMTTAGCGSSASSDTPTGPSPTTYTDTFTGTVTQGTSSYGIDNRNHFTVHAPGNLSASITKLSPISTITVGLGLGIFDAATQTCSLQIGNPVQLNVAVTGSVSTPGELCVGVVDVGNIGSDAIDYEVTVTHT